MKKPALWLLLLAAVAFVVLRTAASREEPGARLRIASTAELSNLDPRIATDRVSFERIYAIMEPLVTYAPSLELQPRLATRWEHSEDGLRLTFHLRRDVRFHHGRPFTSEDVRYTFAWVLDEENQAQNRSLYTDIAQIEASDSHTVVFHLARPNAFLINNVARMPIVPADRGEDVDFGRNPLGTGPYRFVSLRRDERLVLAAFEEYWDGAPSIPEVEFRPIPEDGTRLLALEAGEVDVYQGNVVYREIDRLAKDDRYVLERVTGTGYTYVGLNVQSEPLSDVRVRQALAHLVDREGFVNSVLEGVGEPGISMISPSHRWFNPDVRRFPLDPERARALLAEAGVGEGLRLRLFTNENPARVALAEILQARFAEVGIHLDVRVEEFGAFLERVQTTDDYDLFILGWLGQLDPDRAMYRQFSRGGSANYMYYENDRVTALLEQGRAADPDGEASLAIYHEAQAIVVEEAPMLFVHYDAEVGLRHPYVQGWQVHPYQAATYQNLHRVRITP